MKPIISQPQHTIGRLVLVSSPIGNLEDVSFRAVRELRTADLIAAEDTRRARILLTKYEIQTRLVSYHKDNEHAKSKHLIENVLAGQSVVLLVDSGTPCISDPGYLLVRDAIANGIDPVVIPGPSALTYAVAACGFPVSTFAFAGFLPKTKAKRGMVLRRIASHADTFFLFESPFRIHQLLAEIAENIGPHTRVALIREATKKFEEHIRGTAADLCEQYKGKNWKGEFTVAITTKESRDQPTRQKDPAQAGDAEGTDNAGGALSCR